MDIQNITRYVSAGKAGFTLLDHKANKHYTYRVERDDSGGSNVWFVSFLFRAVGEKAYGYIGMIKDSKFFATKASVIETTHQGFHLFDWIFLQMMRGQELPDHLEFIHSGKCGRCGRELTTPESIETGFGPVCRSKM